LNRNLIGWGSTTGNILNHGYFIDPLAMLWVDWYPTFINFLRAIPGRNGIPLSYICRKVPTTIQPTYTDFIDEYIDRAPLNGAAYTTDTAEVYTYLVKFISDNDTAEAKVSTHSASRDGRLAYISLQEHYEGVGVHAIDVTKADRYLDNLYYNGEKRPHMWWERFELLLNETFTIYNKREGRIVHSEDMKLRILCRKVTADFLQVAKSAIQLQLAQVPLNITYDDALTTFRNAVNAKFPPEIAAANSRNRSRRIHELNRRGGGRSSFRGGRGGRGRFQRGGGRHSGRGGRSQLGRHGRRDARMIRCTDGSEMEVHPAYQFTDQEWNLLPEAERTCIIDERNAYKRKRQGNDDRSLISEITTDHNNNPRQEDLRTIAESVQNINQRISSMTSNNDRRDNSTNENLPSPSIMGGRNEQSSLRGSRNRM
jgi:uncharacterized membrane protein YgcG